MDYAVGSRGFGDLSAFGGSVLLGAFLCGLGGVADLRYSEYVRSNAPAPHPPIGQVERPAELIV